MIEKLPIEGLLQVAKTAGAKILEIYYDEKIAHLSELKDDKSPLTLADQASHNSIAQALKNLFPEIPLISEEGKGVLYTERSKWAYYWLIDPLDGTKEFLKRNGEFTVNIALIHHDTPVLGIVYAPVHDVMYYGGTTGSFKKTGNDNAQKISVNNKKDKLIAVMSKSHSTKEEDELLNEYPVESKIEVGSSLKFCMVAEGKADIYYRAGPTMEWDTAAGQAIVEGAGGKVFKNKGPDPFRYNKASLLNGSFLCVGF
jgi:3'(2'), 5'-bisphosphate nucleotidase